MANEGFGDKEAEGARCEGARGFVPAERQEELEIVRTPAVRKGLDSVS